MPKLKMNTTLNYSPNFDVKKKKGKRSKIYYFSLHWDEKRKSSYHSVN